MEEKNLKEVNEDIKETKISFFDILKDWFWNNTENVPQGGEIPEVEEQLAELRKSEKEVGISDGISKELEEALNKAEKIIKFSISDKIKKSKMDKKEEEKMKEPIHKSFRRQKEEGLERE